MPTIASFFFSKLFTGVLIKSSSFSRKKRDVGIRFALVSCFRYCFLPQLLVFRFLTEGKNTKTDAPRIPALFFRKWNGSNIFREWGKNSTVKKDCIFPVAKITHLRMDWWKDAKILCFASPFLWEISPGNSYTTLRFPLRPCFSFQFSERSEKNNWL